MTSAPATHTRRLANISEAWRCPHCNSDDSIGSYGSGMTVHYECANGHEWKLYASGDGHAIEWQPVASDSVRVGQND